MPGGLFETRHLRMPTPVRGAESENVLLLAHPLFTMVLALAVPLKRKNGHFPKEAAVLFSN